MSISVQGRVGWASIPNALGRSRLPHPTLHLLINLLTHSEGFNAGYSLITQQTGMAPATIAKAIKNLEKLGLLTVGKKKGKSGQFSSNHYTFHADLLWKLTPEFVDERLRPDKTTTDSEVGKDAATGAEVGTATGAEAAPLQELKRKKDQGETSPKNDHPGATPPKKREQGHRIPEDWTPKQSTLDRLKERFPKIDLNGSAEDFRAHWMNATGKGSTKFNWDLAFGTWVKNDNEWGKNQIKAPTQAPSREERLAAWGAPSQAGWATTGDTSTRPRTLAERAGLTTMGEIEQ